MWASWGDFWAMGGYGGYVWGAYGVTLVLLAAEVVLLRARRRRALQHVQQHGNVGSAS